MSTESGMVLVPRAELHSIFKAVEALKLPCGWDPEEPQAARNGVYATIARRLWDLLAAAPASPRKKKQLGAPPNPYEYQSPAAALSGVAAQGDGEARVSDGMWQAACLAYERVTEYPYNRDAIRAAIVAALGVADQENNHV